LQTDPEFRAESFSNRQPLALVQSRSAATAYWPNNWRRWRSASTAEAKRPDRGMILTVAFPACVARQSIANSNPEDDTDFRVANALTTSAIVLDLLQCVARQYSVRQNH